MGHQKYSSSAWYVHLLPERLAATGLTSAADIMKGWIGVGEVSVVPSDRRASLLPFTGSLWATELPAFLRRVTGRVPSGPGTAPAQLVRVVATGRDRG